MHRQHFLDLALETAYEAGEIIKKIYQQEFDVQKKSDNSPVTSADIAANHIIEEAIKSNFPEHGVLSEETVSQFRRGDSDYCWIIDPLDGTKEFIKKTDEFTVNIALTYKSDVIMGVVYAPIFDEMYYAVVSEGAWYIKNGKKTKIEVSDKKDKLNVLISRSRQSTKSKLLIDNNIHFIENVTPMGSSLKGCRIAKGDYDVYYNCGRSMIWDTCAVEIIVREAGGVFSQLNDVDIVYDLSTLSNENGFYILNTYKNHWSI